VRGEEEILLCWGQNVQALVERISEGGWFFKEMGLRVDGGANWREQSILKLAGYLCYKSKVRQ